MTENRQKKQKISRSGFFRELGSSLGQFIDAAFADELTAFAEKFPDLIRPPGCRNESDFLKRCIKCGKCIQACPFIALQPVLHANEFDRGTPCIRTGSAFCRFCNDFPCISACPTGALSLENGNLQKIARAEVIAKRCLRVNEIACEACGEICSRSFKAISFAKANEPPQIDACSCSGCGACLTVCPVTPERAIALRND